MSTDHQKFLGPVGSFAVPELRRPTAPASPAQVLEAQDDHSVHTLLGRVYGRVHLRLGTGPHGLRLESAPVGECRLDRLGVRSEIAAEAEPLGGWMILLVRHGRAGFGSGERGGSLVVGPGTLCAPTEPEQSLRVRLAQADLDQVFIPARRLAAAREPVRLTTRQAKPGAAAAWARTFDYVLDCAQRPELAGAPLLAACLERLLIATTLAAFPNTEVAGSLGVGRDYSHPLTLDRAIAFIEDNAHQDIDLAQIAAACCVGPRAVQLTFRRHLNCTPMAYLRRVRLERAHQDLTEADPARATVAGIAARWGFSNTGRFAAAYRAAYHCAPSTTLHG